MARENPGQTPIENFSISVCPGFFASAGVPLNGGRADRQAVETLQSMKEAAA